MFEQQVSSNPSASTSSQPADQTDKGGRSFSQWKGNYLKVLRGEDPASSPSTKAKTMFYVVATNEFDPKSNSFQKVWGSFPVAWVSLERKFLLYPKNKVAGLSALNWGLSVFQRHNIPEESWDEFDIAHLLRDKPSKFSAANKSAKAATSGQLDEAAQILETDSEKVFGRGAGRIRKQRVILDPSEDPPGKRKRKDVSNYENAPLVTANDCNKENEPSQSISKEQNAPPIIMDDGKKTESLQTNSTAESGTPIITDNEQNGESLQTNSTAQSAPPIITNGGIPPTFPEHQSTPCKEIPSTSAGTALNTGNNNLFRNASTYFGSLDSSFSGLDQSNGSDLIDISNSMRSQFGSSLFTSSLTESESALTASSWNGSQNSMICFTGEQFATFMNRISSMEGAVKSFHTSINGLATKVDSVVASTATPGRAQQQHQYHESVVKKEFDGIPYNEVLQFFHMDTVLENQQIAISLVSFLYTKFGAESDICPFYNTMYSSIFSDSVSELFQWKFKITTNKSTDKRPGITSLVRILAVFAVACNLFTRNRNLPDFSISALGKQTRSIRKSRGQAHRKLLNIDAALAAVDYTKDPSQEILDAIKNKQKQQEDGFSATLKKLILDLECAVIGFQIPNAE